MGLNELEFSALRIDTRGFVFNREEANERHEERWGNEVMKQPDWYKRAWSLDIKNESWTEDTEQQVDFVVRVLGLTGSERILDLACGYGRHALSLARRGFEVVGVDITPAYVEDATKTARAENLNASFILSDIRDVRFSNEFDLVLNMADGAIGYLENDEENLKIFDVIAAALKPGGQHFMDINNAEHAEKHFPKRHWEAGEKALALAEFGWDARTRRMTYAGYDLPYGKTMVKPVISMENADPIRLYSIAELDEILTKRNMKIMSTYSNFTGLEANDREIQIEVRSVKL